MPTPYRHTSPVPRKSATGLVAAVYEQMASDFLLADGPLMSLSSAPDILAATWALTRESEIAGPAPRGNTELVAVAVSRVNRCSYCIDAHTALAHATGEHDLAEAVRGGETPADPRIASLVAWAGSTGSIDAIPVSSLPFPVSEHVAYLGAALVTHVINRVVQSLLHDRLLPGRLGSSATVRRLAGRAFARTVRHDVEPGRSLDLLPRTDICTLPAWAGETPVGAAWSALRLAAGRAGSLLGPDARERVRDVIAAWDGSRPDPALLDSMLVGLPDRDIPGVRLALRAALDPGAISDDMVADWRRVHPSDGDLVRVVVFGAMLAVEQIARWTTTDNEFAMTGD